MQFTLSNNLKLKKEHGGELSIGKRKSRRPFCPKRPVHLVLRSTTARGKLSMRNFAHARVIREMTSVIATKWAVRLYETSNNGNHLHLLLRARDRRGFQNFLRELAGKIAMRVTGGRNLVWVCYTTP